MRRGKIEDKVITLTEKEYDMLLDRFNLANIEIDKQHVIRRPCLCILYTGGSCYNDKQTKRCPLRWDKFNTCSVLVEKIINDENWYFQLDTNYLSWSMEPGINKWARNSIRKLRKALVNMEKVWGR